MLEESLQGIEESSQSAILDKLKRALRSDGDFPVRARVITDLRIMSSKPNTSIPAISEMILKEPALGTRVLHLVNSAFYQRSRPINTISQAVMHIGMRALSDLCAGLVLLQRFKPTAKRGGIFTDNLKSSVLNSIISSHLATGFDSPEIAERGYLAGAFYALGPLLLAYYFPQVYDAAGKRALARGHDISQSISEMLGIKPVRLSQAILDALDIPLFYQEVLEQSYSPLSETKEGSNETRLGHTVAVGARLSIAILNASTPEELCEVCDSLEEESLFSAEELNQLLNDLPEMFEEHCRMIDMAFLTLPDALRQLAEQEQSDEGTGAEDNDTKSKENGGDFSHFVSEIKNAISQGEPISSVISTAMEALVYALEFDRALLLMKNRNASALEGRISLGKEYADDVKSISRPLSDSSKCSPEIQAFSQGSPVLFGDPLFPGYWPFAAIPVGQSDHCLGVVYADTIETESGGTPLDQKKQAAVALLTDLLNRAVLEQ